MKKQARQRGYKVLASFRPDEILPHTGPDARRQSFMCNDGEVRLVKMTSLRYQTFKKNLRCRCCGIEGSVFLLEMPNNGGDICVPHFNLYAEREGGLIQMTKDHKTPKSRGGKDHINNMQTMCSRCNELKGHYATKLKRLREIQDGVQTVYTVIYPSDEGIRTMDGFATSDRGLAEIVRRYVVKEYQWGEDTFEVRVSTRQKLVRVHNEIGEPLVFIIKPIRRV